MPLTDRKDYTRSTYEETIRSFVRQTIPAPEEQRLHPVRYKKKPLQAGFMNCSSMRAVDDEGYGRGIIRILSAKQDWSNRELAGQILLDQLKLPRLAFPRLMGIGEAEIDDQKKVLMAYIHPPGRHFTELMENITSLDPPKEALDETLKFTQAAAEVLVELAAATPPDPDAKRSQSLKAARKAYVDRYEFLARQAQQFLIGVGKDPFLKTEWKTLIRRIDYDALIQRTKTLIESASTPAYVHHSFNPFNLYCHHLPDGQPAFVTIDNSRLADSADPATLLPHGLAAFDYEEFILLLEAAGIVYNIERERIITLAKAFQQRYISLSKGKRLIEKADLPPIRAHLYLYLLARVVRMETIEKGSSRSKAFLANPNTSTRLITLMVERIEKVLS